MVKLDIISSSLSSGHEELTHVFSGKLELAGCKSGPVSEEYRYGGKSIILRIGLDSFQMLELLAQPDEGHTFVHIILYESGNEISLPVEYNDAGSLPSGCLEVRYPLSKCEKPILESLANGLKYSEIAENRNLSIHTVKCHVSNIYKKLDVNNRSKATSKYINFINPPHSLSARGQTGNGANFYLAGSAPKARAASVRPG
jgi:DNA-binding CsgD family transcriptional regulator